MAPIPMLGTAWPSDDEDTKLSGLSSPLSPATGSGLLLHSRDDSNNNVLEKRYQTVSIPATYANLNDSLQPGVIAGIVLGSTAGFILLVYFLFVSCGGCRYPRTRRSSRRYDVDDDSTTIEEIDYDDTYRLSSIFGRRRRPARRRERRREVEEIIRPVRKHHRRRHRKVPRRVIVEESLTSGTGTADDIVEVVEEGSPRPRRSRR